MMTRTQTRLKLRDTDSAQCDLEATAPYWFLY